MKDKQHKKKNKKKNVNDNNDVLSFLDETSFGDDDGDNVLSSILSSPKSGDDGEDNYDVEDNENKNNSQKNPPLFLSFPSYSNKYNSTGQYVWVYGYRVPESRAKDFAYDYENLLEKSTVYGCVGDDLENERRKWRVYIDAIKQKLEAWKKIDEKISNMTTQQLNYIKNNPDPIYKKGSIDIVFNNGSTEKPWKLEVRKGISATRLTAYHERSLLIVPPANIKTIKFDPNNEKSAAEVSLKANELSYVFPFELRQLFWVLMPEFWSSLCDGSCKYAYLFTELAVKKDLITERLERLLREYCPNAKNYNFSDDFEEIKENNNGRQEFAIVVRKDPESVKKFEYKLKEFSKKWEDFRKNGICVLEKKTPKQNKDKDFKGFTVYDEEWRYIDINTITLEQLCKYKNRGGKKGIGYDCLVNDKGLITTKNNINKKGNDMFKHWVDKRIQRWTDEKKQGTTDKSFEDWDRHTAEKYIKVRKEGTTDKVLGPENDTDNVLPGPLYPVNINKTLEEIVEEETQQMRLKYLNFTSDEEKEPLEQEIVEKSKKNKHEKYEESKKELVNEEKEQIINKYAKTKTYIFNNREVWFGFYLDRICPNKKQLETFKRDFVEIFVNEEKTGILDLISQRLEQWKAEKNDKNSLKRELYKKTYSGNVFDITIYNNASNLCLPHIFFGLIDRPYIKICRDKKFQNERIYIFPNEKCINLLLEFKEFINFMETLELKKDEFISVGNNDAINGGEDDLNALQAQLRNLVEKNIDGDVKKFIKNFFGMTSSSKEYGDKHLGGGNIISIPESKVKEFEKILTNFVEDLNKRAQLKEPQVVQTLLDLDRDCQLHVAENSLEEFTLHNSSVNRSLEREGLNKYDVLRGILGDENYELLSYCISTITIENNSVVLTLSDFYRQNTSTLQKVVCAIEGNLHLQKGQVGINKKKLIIINNVNAEITKRSVVVRNKEQQKCDENILLDYSGTLSSTYAAIDILRMLFGDKGYELIKKYDSVDVIIDPDLKITIMCKYDNSETLVDDSALADGINKSLKKDMGILQKLMNDARDDNDKRYCNSTYSDKNCKDVLLQYGQKKKNKENNFPFSPHMSMSEQSFTFEVDLIYVQMLRLYLSKQKETRNKFDGSILMEKDKKKLQTESQENSNIQQGDSSCFCGFQQKIDENDKNIEIKKNEEESGKNTQQKFVFGNSANYFTSNNKGNKKDNKDNGDENIETKENESAENNENLRLEEPEEQKGLEEQKI